ncbi:MAG: PAS domain-containing protein [Negativicutes bacterium]|nr:PAS domain-containing protein [Negativicutes bacterium]
MEEVKGFTKFAGILSDIRKLVDEAYELSEARRLEDRALADDALDLSETRRITERDAAEEALDVSERRRLVERSQSDQAIILSEKRRTTERDKSEKASQINASRSSLEVSLVQEEINKLNRQIIQVFESMHEACLIFDHDFHLIYINPQAQLLYWPDADVAGKTINELFPEEVREVFFRKCVGDKMPSGLIHVRSDNFQINKCVQISFYPAEYGFLVFFEDITEAKPANKK